MSRPDEQPVSNWSEFMEAARDCREKNKNEVIFDIMFHPFPTGWEKQEENGVLKKLNLEYRKWVDGDKAAPKGFVAKTNTKALNERRKQITWIRRREELGQETTTRKKQE